jgi:hypothetical protein
MPKKYYMSLDNLAVVDGTTEQERFYQAREEFKKMLLDETFVLEIVCVDTDEYDE